MQQREKFRPWLVQRLERDGRPARDGDSTPTQFIARVGAFDYMGSSEFELGSVPEAVNRMVAASKTLVTAARQVLVTKPELWPDQAKALGQAWAEAPAELPVTVYVIAYQQKLEQVFAWIQAEDAREKYPRLKEPTQFQKEAYLQNWDGNKTALKKVGQRFTGWFEIREDFFYFTSRDQWLAVCKILGVTSQE